MAIIDVMSVPTIAGKAPNLSVTGFHELFQIKEIPKVLNAGKL
jgi:hypothetical protein